MESKEQLKTRLKQEGRWNEFIGYREKLKAEGMPAKDAWYEARQKFGPESYRAEVAGSDCDNDTVVPDDIICMDVFADKPSVTARAVVQWVFDHIDIEGVKPQDAPSAGAWSFLQRVRSYPDLLKEFYRTIWAKMLPTRSEIEARERFEDDGREQLHLIDQIQRARDRANE